jgi:hypothetical protein
MDVTFRLIQDDLANYRYVVRDHMAKVPDSGFWSKPWVRATAVLVATFVCLQVFDRLIVQFTGHPASYVELAIGFVAGGAFVLCLLWVHHWDQTRKLVRLDGPTLSEHTVSVNTSGLTMSAPHMTAHYMWPAIQEVTKARGLVVLWLEPSVGLAVPERAFPNPEACQEFIAAIEARRTESVLPRAGSFS